MTWSVEKSLQRQRLRNHIRLQRRALTPAQQQAAALAVKEHALSDARICAAATLAVFLSFDGELNTRPLIEALWLRGQRVYLPVLHPFTPGHLLFLRYTPDTKLVRNHLHIQQPRLDITTLLPAAELDVLFTPLVAFDNTGQRLGMGGGFYDRTLSTRRAAGSMYPIGLAHDCQLTGQLPVEPWDMPLPEIITPARHWRWQG